MYIFRLKLDYNGIDDSFYFTNPPTKEDAIRAIRKNASLAGPDWWELYNNFEKTVEIIDFSKGPKTTGSFCGTGQLIPEFNVIFDLSRHNVIENGSILSQVLQVLEGNK